MYYVYVICKSDGGIYIGYSNNVERRLAEHNSGENKSTKGHPWKLVYYEAYFSRKDAMRRERMLKQRGQAKRHLKERISDSLQACCAELSAR